ncbi:Hydantoinase/oxoprolinase [Solidesulfovibrio carbinoliphilus subsp. oakridgensis]|uniref:Hydantoinase/oxoprolinase n=1 Tax=Solidesulfovibrio carbinoliphilus subsp. oakridgensis TaxID=694327 RepID=G7Q705_9BACT|nr:hydantoinase/oxoprolinase family protein [Solidesulfovibrio carbinoliphilus]EHJ48488.1 Hydantoinase/oxoprolinase [Solidesulfovibrio carbinoliphilus subsp. oakridgensis]
MLLGIDVGGTHTDAVLIGRDGVVACAKLRTNHDDLLASIREVLSSIVAVAGPGGVARLNLSTTLSTNAIIEGTADPVGVLVSGGPGIDPEAYRIGDHYFVLPGAIDHRGRETAPLDADAARAAVAACHEAGVRVHAAVTKFSTRHPDQEMALAALLAGRSDCVSLGHAFSGRLGFGRRIATAYCNSAVWRIYNRFCDAVEQSVTELGLAPGIINVLKADGGTMPLTVSRSLPVQSILSGPAASVMGIIAVCDIVEDSVILDIGGTTTDIAVFAAGAPLIENEGIAIAGRPTLVRALRTRSIGVGGDSALTVSRESVRVGPRRLGPPMALGGPVPTLVDALNIQNVIALGDPRASYQGIAAAGAPFGFDPEEVADAAILNAVNQIRSEVAAFVREINDRPVYTIFDLLEGRTVKPTRVYVMGGPALALSALLQDAFSEEVVVPESFAVANAIGAALARPTFSVELFADTATGRLTIPSLGVARSVAGNFSPAAAEGEAATRLRDYLSATGADPGEAPVETVELSSFPMVEGQVQVGHNIRVACQVRPGILSAYKKAVSQSC